MEICQKSHFIIAVKHLSTIFMKCLKGHNFMPSLPKYRGHNNLQGCQQQIAKSEENTPGVKGAAQAPFAGPGQSPGGGPGGKAPLKLLDSDDLVCPKINFLDSKFDFLGCL
jgi:hypothetical protein